MGRSAFEGSHNRDVAVDGLHRDPEAVVGTVLPLLQRGVGAGSRKCEWDPASEHAVDRAGHELLALDLVHVLALDRAQDRGVEPQLLARVLGAAGLHPPPPSPPAHGCQDDDGEARRSAWPFVHADDIEARVLAAPEGQ